MADPALPDLARTLAALDAAPEKAGTHLLKPKLLTDAARLLRCASADVMHMYRALQDLVVKNEELEDAIRDRWRLP